MTESPKKHVITPRKFAEAMKESGLEQRFFTILAEGAFTPEKVETVLTEPGATFPKSDRWKQAIHAAWERWKQKEKERNPKFKEWPNDEKPSRYNLADFEVTDRGLLQVALDPCISYAEYIGGQDEEFKKSFPNAEQPYPLAVSTSLIARDKNGQEHVLLTRRSAGHDYKPLGYHITGGFMTFDDQNSEKTDKTPVDAAKREAAEESGAKREDVKEEDLVCRGIIHNNMSGHADMVFEARTEKTKEEIEAMHNDEENTRLFIPLTPSSLREWIIAPTHANVVITSASLALLGKARFGQVWYDDVMTMLAYRSKDYGDPAVEAELAKKHTERLGVKWRHAGGEKDASEE